MHNPPAVSFSDGEDSEGEDIMENIEEFVFYFPLTHLAITAISQNSTSTSATISLKKMKISREWTRKRVLLQNGKWTSAIAGSEAADSKTKLKKMVFSLTGRF